MRSPKRLEESRNIRCLTRSSRLQATLLNMLLPLHAYNTPPLLHTPLASPQETQPENNDRDGNVEDDEEVREMRRRSCNKLQQMQRKNGQVHNLARAVEVGKGSKTAETIERLTRLRYLTNERRR